jgi:hypothetical protein
VKASVPCTAVARDVERSERALAEPEVLFPSGLMLERVVVRLGIESGSTGYRMEGRGTNLGALEHPRDGRTKRSRERARVSWNIHRIVDGKMGVGVERALAYWSIHRIVGEKGAWNEPGFSGVSERILHKRW